MTKLRNNGFLAILVSIALVISLTPSVVWADPGTPLTTVPQGSQALVVDPTGSGDYTSLQEAVDAAEDGATIQLAADLAESTPTVIEGKSLTIDLAGHTISGANIEKKSIISVIDGADVTISNGTMRDGHSYNDYDNGRRTNGSGGIYAYDSNLVVKDMNFYDNIEQSGVGYVANSVYVNKGSLTIENCTFDNDLDKLGNDYHAAVATEYAKVTVSDSAFHNQHRALSIHGGDAVITNCDISNNKTKTSSGIIRYTYGDKKGDITLKGCTIQDNETNDNLSAIILLEGGSDWVNMTLENCTVTNNTSNSGGIIRTTNGFSGSGWNVFKLKDTIVADNTSIDGAVEIGSYTRFQMDNSVIKNNVATGRSGSYLAQSGGVKFYGLEFSMTNSAVYNNVQEKVAPSSPGVANDVYSYMNTRYQSYYPGFGNALAAKDFYDFSDPDYDFSSLVWKDGKDTGYEEKPEAFLKGGYYYTITDVNSLHVAQIGDVLYESLEAAFVDAQDGDTIEIIAKEQVITVPKGIPVNKNVTLEIGDHKVVYRPTEGSTEPLFNVQDGVTFTLAKNQSEYDSTESNPTTDFEGGIEKGTVVVNDGARLVLADSMVTDVIELNGTMAVDALQKAMHIILGEGKYVELGDAYDDASYKQAKLAIELPEAVLAALNEGESDDVVLTKGGNEGLFNGITVRGLANSKVAKKMSDGNIVLHVGDALYIDGVNGNDDADGTTAATAVKSFAEVEKRIAADPELDTVIVVGTVTVADEQTWTLPEGALMVRDDAFMGPLVRVGGSGALDLSHIAMSGKSDMDVYAHAPLIKVESKGALVIGEGTVLSNNANRAPGNSYRQGGAVHSMGTTTMLPGSLIDGCEACYGGGICQESGTFTMAGGTISHNEAITYGNYLGAGGGVMLISGAKVTMGGEDGSQTPAIIANRASGQGGGVSVGAEWAVNHWYYKMVDGKAQKLGTAFIMKSGLIDGNTAGYSGGGIFIQDSMEGYLYGGAITNNAAYAATNRYFAGGGVYVNGIHSVDDGRYIEANRYMIHTDELAVIEKNFEHGYLYLENVEITNNTANWLGGALATCDVSKTIIGDFSTAIHDNFINNAGPTIAKTSGDNVDIFLSTINHYTQGMEGKYHPLSYVSNYMIGGGEYRWTNPVTGSLIPTSGTTEYEAERSLYEGRRSLRLVSGSCLPEDMQAAIQGSKLLISGNYSGSNAGGLGSDGIIVFGSIVPKVDVAVNKTWVEDNEDTRPQAIKYNLYRQAGEDVSTKELYKEVVVRIEKSTLDDGTEAVATYAYPCKDGVETGDKVKLADEATYAYTWLDLLKFVPNSNPGIAYTYSVEEDLSFVVGQDDAGNDLTMGDLYVASPQQGDETSRTIQRPNAQGGVDELAQPVYNWTITNSPKPEPEEPEETTEIEEPEPPANNPPTETPEEPETPNEPAKQETPKQPATPKTATPAKPATGQAKTGDAAPILPLTALALAAAASGIIAWRSYRRNEE